MQVPLLSFRHFLKLRHLLPSFLPLLLDSSLPIAQYLLDFQLCLLSHHPLASLKRPTLPSPLKRLAMPFVPETYLLTTPSS